MEPVQEAEVVCFVQDTATSPLSGELAVALDTNPALVTWPWPGMGHAQTHTLQYSLGNLVGSVSQPQTVPLQGWAAEMWNTSYPLVTFTAPHVGVPMYLEKSKL